MLARDDVISGHFKENTVDDLDDVCCSDSEIRHYCNLLDENQVRIWLDYCSVTERIGPLYFEAIARYLCKYPEAWFKPYVYYSGLPLGAD